MLQLALLWSCKFTDGSFPIDSELSCSYFSYKLINLFISSIGFKWVNALLASFYVSAEKFLYIWSLFSSSQQLIKSHWFCHFDMHQFALKLRSDFFSCILISFWLHTFRFSLRLSILIVTHFQLVFRTDLFDKYFSLSWLYLWNMYKFLVLFTFYFYIFTFLFFFVLITWNIISQLLLAFICIWYCCYVMVSK